ncbi:MAG: hypothetical protein IJL87_08070 [Clostridia bacterium]|nr:hypothetical protein [Clostridia bacterium]
MEVKINKEIRNYTESNSAEEYASDKVETEIIGTTEKTVRQFDKQRQKSFYITKEELRKFKENRAEKALKEPVKDSFKKATIKEPLKRYVIHRTEGKSVKTLSN